MNYQGFLFFLPCFLLRMLSVLDGVSAAGIKAVQGQGLPPSILPTSMLATPNSVTALSCVMTCGLSFGEAWVKVLEQNPGVARFIGGTPSAANPDNGRRLFQQLMDHTGNLVGEEQEDAFENVCTVYDEYHACMGECPKEMLRKVIENGLASLKMICGPKKKEYLKVIPCLSEKHKEVESQCKKAKDRAAVAASLLHSSIVASPVNMLATLAEFCDASSVHTGCLMPRMTEACGAQTTELMKDIWAESFEMIQAFMTQAKVKLPEECTKILAQLAPIVAPAAAPVTVKPSTEQLTQIASPLTAEEITESINSEAGRILNRNSSGRQIPFFGYGSLVLITLVALFMAF